MRMTEQAHDACRFEGRDHALCAWAGEGRVKAADLPIVPQRAHTAWHRGYLAHYSVSGERLHLWGLTIRSDLAPDEAPSIDGRSPVRDGSELAYRDLDRPIPLTGGLLLGSRPRRERVALRLPWNYDQVLELLFDGGRLLESWDRSSELESMRRCESAYWRNPEDAALLGELFAGFMHTYRPSLRDVFE